MNDKHYEIIKGPVVTEKATNLASSNTYVFKVSKNANKTAIKKAIEHIFKVQVENVTTSITKPKKKRIGRYTGMTQSYKKAFVKLKEGSKIELN